MSYAYAHEYSYRHKHRHRRKNKLARLLRRLHEPHKLMFYLCLLIAGCTLFGAAIHFYYLGHENEARGTLEAIDQAGSDYTRTMVLGVVGLLPFRTRRFAAR